MMLALFALGESEAHHAGAFTGSQFHGDIVVEELDLVVAGGGRFLVMRIARSITGVGILLGAGHQLRLADLRHEQEVAQVGNARAGQMRQGEAHDRGVGVLVAGGGVPEVPVGIRAELDHAEGRRGAGIGIALALRADEGADVVGQMRLGGARPEERQAHQKQAQSERGHSCPQEAPQGNALRPTPKACCPSDGAADRNVRAPGWCQRRLPSAAAGI